MIQPIVSITMGSDSDLPIMQAAVKTLEEFGIAYEITVISAHRTPERAHEYFSNARENGFKVLITAAGGAAHLSGVAAAYTTLPVIGVPIKSDTLNGVDSLYSIVQMPPGIPVATVAINGAKNAALLAVQILAVSDEALAQKLREYKNEMRDQVLSKTEKLEKLGVDQYLAENSK